MNSGSLLKKVTEGCFDEIYFIDANSSTYLDANQTALNQLDYSREELQQRHPWQLACDFTQTEWLKQLEPLLSGQQQKVAITTRHTCKNGKQYPVILHVMLDTSKQRQVFLVIGKDLSFFQRVIETTSESNERCAAIVSNLPGLVFQLSLKQHDVVRYLFLSSNCESTLGVLPEKLYASPANFIDMILPEDRASYQTSMVKSAQTLKQWTWEGRIWITKWSDIKWIHLRAVPRLQADSSVIWEGIITDITARKLIDVEIHLYRQRLSELSAHIERIKELERTRIAREIHDDMGGNLVAAKMVLHTMENRFPTDQPWLAEKTKYINTLIDRTIEAAHRISRDLRPSVLDLGIIPALEWQIKEFEKQYAIKCSFSTNKNDISLTPEHSTALFRMVQEALTNIAKHANATYVSLSIVYTRTSINLTIADNGCGLNTELNSKPNSFGLLGMAERCKEIGGTVLVDSQPGNGCVITIRIPLILQTQHYVVQPNEPLIDQFPL